MSSKWHAETTEAAYCAETDEKECDRIRVLRYCTVDGVESMLTVMRDSIWLEEKSGGRVMIAGSQTEGGFGDGPGLVARFWAITDICVDGNNKLIICDSLNRRVRMMDLTFPYQVVTLCGRFAPLYVDLSAMTLKVCVDDDNNIYISDVDSNVIHKIDSKREKIEPFFDSSMVEKFYHGAEGLKQYGVLKSPNTIMIQNNENLIIFNESQKSLCQVSLHDKRYSVLKYGFEFDSTFAMDKNGDIIVCENQGGGDVAFHIIFRNGEQIHIADKTGPEISVIQVAIQQHYISDPLCLATIEYEQDLRKYKIVQSKISLGSNWKSL